jgi:hypothetical protein
MIDSGAGFPHRLARQAQNRRKRYCEKSNFVNEINAASSVELSRKFPLALFRKF